MEARSAPARAGAQRQAWIWLLGAFAGFTVLALSGAIPRGPIGDWTTPWWADLVLAPFSGIAMLLAALAVLLARLSGRLTGTSSVLLTRIVFALIVATSAEVVLKAAFPGSAGILGSVFVGPFEFGFYPSGHSLRATIVALSLIALGPITSPARWILLALPFAIGSMLVSAGGHFPIDVVGGILLGAAAASWALAPAPRRDV